MTAKKKTASAKRRPSIDTYEFDTSSYIVINAPVRRDSHSGRLVVKAAAQRKTAAKR